MGKWVLASTAWAHWRESPGHVGRSKGHAILYLLFTWLLGVVQTNGVLLLVFLGLFTPATLPSGQNTDTEA